MGQLIEDGIGKAGSEPINLCIVVEFGVRHYVSELCSVGDDEAVALSQLLNFCHGGLGSVRIVEHRLELLLEGPHEDSIGSCFSR